MKKGFVILLVIAGHTIFSRTLLDLVVFLAILAIISIIKKAKRSS